MIKLTEILAEIGEGSSKPFEYKKGFMSAGFKRKGGFNYEIAGEIRNDTGEFVLQEMPIELQAIPFREMLEYVGDELLDLDASKTGRHRLYSIFIKKAFPSAKEFFHKEGDYILYKLS